VAVAALREREVDLESLRRAAERVAPVTLAGERSLPVLEALAPLLPGGLRRGVTATVDAAAGPGATALALALGAGASAAGSWVAAVGLPALGWQAASELGVAPERLLVVADPPRDSVATVVAALLDGVDVVYVHAGAVSAPDARRLVARAREREVVLVPVAGRGGRPGGSTWPLGADVRLSVAEPEWQWDGRLVARRVRVTVSGKGVYARERSAALWLPDSSGRVSPA